MNENANLMAALLMGLNQVQNVKDKIDPEVFELLRTSGHEAIASAHHFLDACDKAIDSLVDQREIELEDELDNDAESSNVVNLNAREA